MPPIIVVLLILFGSVVLIGLTLIAGIALSIGVYAGWKALLAEIRKGNK